MKGLFILSSLLGLSVTLAFGQSDKEDIDILQATYGKEKKELVKDNLRVGKDSVNFWKVYDEYEVKRKGLARERIELLRQYAESYEAMSGPTAAKIVSGTLDNDLKYTNLLQQYYTKFSSTIGNVEAARLIYLEYYLQTLIKQRVQENLPGIKEIEKPR